MMLTIVNLHPMGIVTNHHVTLIFKSYMLMTHH